jgi:hypothetical protein
MIEGSLLQFLSSQLGARGSSAKGIDNGSIAQIVQVDRTVRYGVE